MRVSMPLVIFFTTVTFAAASAVNMAAAGNIPSINFTSMLIRLVMQSLSGVFNG